MFSSRMFVALALVAAAAAYPADNGFLPQPITTITEADLDDGASWWSFPSLDTFFAPLLKFFPSFSEIGPRIEIDDDIFRVVVNVKGYKKDDLKVKVKNEFIYIQGAHDTKDSDHDIFASHFFHAYSLPPNASAADVVAKLYTDNFLVVSSPLKGSGDKADTDTEVEVPITEESEPFKKEVAATTVRPEIVEAPVNPVVPETPDVPENPEVPEELDTKTEGTTNVPTTASDADDRREQTTSSDREEVTEKDNTILHGPDASEANELNEVRP